MKSIIPYLENMNQKVIDKDSFNIITNYVEELEDEENRLKRKTHWKYLDVLAELAETNELITKDEKMIKKNSIIKENYSKDILRTIEMDKYLNKKYSEDYYEDYSEISSDEEDMFTTFTWFNGASCDI